MASNSSYDSWHEQVGVSESVQADLFFAWHKAVARLLPAMEGKSVLEIGCGRGDFSLWLARKYPATRFTAMDFSPVAIDIARSRCRGESNVNFVVGNAESLPFASQRFDLVISCECMEHVSRPQRMADEIGRMLKAGGEFILTTENYCNGMVLAWLKSWLTRSPFDSGSGVQPRENFFLFWRVRSLLRRGGLAVEHMESNHFQWFLCPRVAPAKLCTEDFESRFWKRFFRPFGRHFTFQGSKA